MPDSFEHMPAIAIRMPNGALTSLAGNVDAHHRVAVADLILVQRRVRETVLRLVREQVRNVRLHLTHISGFFGIPQRHNQGMGGIGTRIWIDILLWHHG